MKTARQPLLRDILGSGGRLAVSIYARLLFIDSIADEGGRGGRRLLCASAHSATQPPSPSGC